jgi:hypothetical protein
MVIVVTLARTNIDTDHAKLLRTCIYFKYPMYCNLPPKHKRGGPKFIVSSISWWAAKQAANSSSWSIIISNRYLLAWRALFISSRYGQPLDLPLLWGPCTWRGVPLCGGPTWHYTIVWDYDTVVPGLMVCHSQGLGNTTWNTSRQRPTKAHQIRGHNSSHRTQ